MFQVVVEVFGEATAVVVMFIPFADPSDYPSISSLSISIYMMATIMTGIQILMAKQTEAPETNPPRLVCHAEGVAIDRSLSSPHNERRGVGRVGLSGPGSIAAQGTDAGERDWPEGGSQSRFR